MPRFSGFLTTALLLGGCAQTPVDKPQPKPEPPPATLGTLPATYVDEAGCPGCLAATMRLRADGSFLLRFTDTRAAETLKDEFQKQPERPVLVSLDAQLEGTPETLRMFRAPMLHNARTCP